MNTTTAAAALAHLTTAQRAHLIAAAAHPEGRFASRAITRVFAAHGLATLPRFHGAGRLTAAGRDFAGLLVALRLRECLQGSHVVFHTAGTVTGPCATGTVDHVAEPFRTGGTWTVEVLIRHAGFYAVRALQDVTVLDVDVDDLHLRALLIAARNLRNAPAAA